MNASYKILDPKDLEGVNNEQQAFARDVLLGLSEWPKRLKSKYFYDEEGSRLFQQIMALGEYYLTNCEYQILEIQKEKLSQLLGEEEFNVVELGAGDGLKTNILLNHFLEKKIEFQYLPIDISESAMRFLIHSIGKQFPSLETRGIVAEYFEALKWISRFAGRRNLVLFLGSNLGNFSKVETRVFLRSLWDTLKHGDYVLIGFDLKKDIDLMLSAYNDNQGITARFNLNLLQRINRELGGNFDLTKFRFYATYNVFSGAIESYLVSQEEQSVYIDRISQMFQFKAWEPIHTEYSYKYLESDIHNLAEATGYTIEMQLYDEQKYFLDSLWRVEKEELSATR